MTAPNPHLRLVDIARHSVPVMPGREGVIAEVLKAMQSVVEMSASVAEHTPVTYDQESADIAEAIRELNKGKTLTEAKGFFAAKYGAK